MKIWDFFKFMLEKVLKNLSSRKIAILELTVKRFLSLCDNCWGTNNLVLKQDINKNCSYFVFDF